MLIFKDRKSAGKLLSKRLKGYKNKSDTLVLGIPRGGVVVAAEIARILKLPLDIVVTRKIGVPSQPELALGAVDSGGNVAWEESILKDTGLEPLKLKEEIEKEVKEIKRREGIYRAGKGSLNVLGKRTILVDDGVATGATMLSAIRFLRSISAKFIVLAVPVAAKESIRRLSGEADETIVLHIPEHLMAVGSFYQNFTPVSDEEVIQLLS